MHNTYRLGFRVVCGQTPHLKVSVSSTNVPMPIDPDVDYWHDEKC